LVYIPLFGQRQRDCSACGKATLIEIVIQSDLQTKSEQVYSQYVHLPVNGTLFFPLKIDSRGFQMSIAERAWRPAIPTAILSETKSSRQEHTEMVCLADGARAEQAAHICAMAEFLGIAERSLLRSVYADGKSAVQIAALLSLRPRSVQRRVRRLAARVLRPEFGYIARQTRAMRVERAWDAPTRAVALMCILEGRSVRATAAALTMTQHAVRARRATVLAIAASAVRSDRAAPDSVSARASAPAMMVHRSPGVSSGALWRTSARVSGSAF
jgi:hypothetical protein